MSEQLAVSKRRYAIWLAAPSDPPPEPEPPKPMTIEAVKGHERHWSKFSSEFPDMPERDIAKMVDIAVNSCSECGRDPGDCYCHDCFC